MLGFQLITGIVEKLAFLGGSAFTVVAFYALYNLFIHPLRHYPGPLLWRAFRVPYVLSMHSGYLHCRLKEMHDIYGPIVRIAPNELSYIDGRAWKDIYGNRPGHLPFERNSTWVKLPPNDPGSIQDPDEEIHARNRKAFTPAFSERNLKDMAPILEWYVEQLVDQLSRTANSGKDGKDGTANLVQWLDFLSFDIAGDLSFGESFECVKSGQAHPWVEIAHGFGKGLALTATLNHYPALAKLLQYFIPRKVLQKFKDHRDMSRAKARKRMALDTVRPDFITPAKKYADEQTQLAPGEWENNMSIIVFAGSETVSTSLCAILHTLLQHPDALRRTVEEVRGSFENEAQIKLSSVAALRYLNAVISEGMRLNPAVVIGVPRVAPKGGDTICGQWVPEGTMVAFNQFPAYRSSTNYHEPESFLPERFLHTSSEGGDDMHVFQPFGVGRHSCLGMRVAWAEMRLVLARLLYSFDVELAETKDRWEWAEQKTFIFWEKRPLVVRLRRVN